MSTWTLVRVGFGEPHQLLTAAKSTDCLGTYAVILKAPVPTAVDGVLHQLSGFVLTTFLSTIWPVVPAREIADRNQPAGLLSLATTVYGSGAERPLRVTDGSCFSSSAS